MDDTVAGSGYGSPYLDSLIWGCKWSSEPGDPAGPLQIAVHFGAPGEDLPGFAQTWDARQMNAFRSAFQLYENVANIDFVEVGSFGAADMVEWLVPQSYFGNSTLGMHEVPDPSETIAPPYGYFNTTDSSWANLSQGSFGFITIIHELGHALGLAHPHDGGDRLDEPDASVFPGVTPNSTGDTGDSGLNQGIWTTMTYNDGWNQAPATSEGYGYQGTPMAFDIAALQQLYGANMTFHAGDDSYALPTANGSGTFWSCIWDAGGLNDEISGASATGNCTINLNAATLQAFDSHAGGYVSSVDGIIGGFTIANGVVIERATGGKGHDTLTGNAAANLLTGNGGNDWLDGGAGGDTMIGGAGDDTYIVDNLGDKITEDVDGLDTVRSSLTFLLADANLENLILTGQSAIDGTGNASANQLIGNAAANLLDGLGGDDTMRGGDGDDTYILDAAGDVVDESANAGIDTIKSKQSYTLGANLENLVLLAAALTANGNALANQLTGNDQANTLDGKAGADVMSGGKGDDVYFMDIATDQIIEAPGEGSDEVYSAVALKAVIAGVEHYVFTSKTAVNFLADDTDNLIVATAAADTLDGAAGNDTLQGGGGNDLYFVDATTDKVTEDAKQGTDLVKSSSDFTLDPNIENLTLTGSADIDGTGNELPNVIIGNAGANALSGDAGNDTLTGGDGADTLDGGAGNDAMTGGNGDDVYGVESNADKVTESAAAGGHDKVESAITYVLGANLEDLDLSSAVTANGTGNTLANLIVGSAGANILDGKTGADTLRGGGGDDTYIIDNANDVVDETGGGIDTLVTPFATDLAADFPDFENLTLTGKALTGFGTAAANLITGNTGANTLSGLDQSDTLVGGTGNDSLDGGAGNDSLDGGAGTDRLVGGAGDDTYVVDSAKDIVQETGIDTADRIKASIAVDLNSVLYDNVEDVTLTGGGALKATGDEQKNELRGNAGANLLIGNGSDDTLIGESGNDTLDGGTGMDSLAGGLGNDTYLIGDLGNTVAEASGEGTDVVRSSVDYTLDANVENLVLLIGAVSGTGNGFANLLTGNDVANILDGQGGVDSLIGGKGDDAYFVDDAKDVITEAAGVGSGVDTVTSTAASYMLGANLERLVLGTGAVSGTGNTLDNSLTGNAGDNTLDGEAGKDHAIGGDGDDTYIVDNIGDVVDENGTLGTDTVKSSIAFSLVEDGTMVIGSVENLTLTGAAGIAGTGNDSANHLIGNSGANKLFGNGAGDVIDGGGGADTLDGGAGNDSLTGGAGNDRIDVANGDDTVFYTNKLDGKDIIDHFDGGGAGGQDRLSLDVLFDALGITDGARETRVSITGSGAMFEVRVDADGKAGFELAVATLNLAVPGDPLTVGQDILVN